MQRTVLRVLLAIVMMAGVPLLSSCEKESSSTSPSTSSSKSKSVQCRGYTEEGSRCKRMTTSSSGYCWQHD